MRRSPKSVAIAAAALFAFCVVYDGLFGDDGPGTKHDISVGVFFVSVAALAVLVGCGLVALAGTARRRRRV